MSRSALGNFTLLGAAASILAAVALLVILVYGKSFLVPLVIALMLAGVISAAIVRLEAIGFPAWLATLCAIGAGFAVPLLIVAIFYGQMDAVADAWPRYTARLGQLVASVTAMSVPDLTETLTKSIKLKDLSGPLSNFALSAGAVFGSALLVAMYAGFLLAERGNLTSKFGYLITDPERAAEFSTIIKSVRKGIHSYLWIQTVMSFLTAGLCYVILLFYGVDFAEVWALLIFLLNFIPTIGSIIAVIIPALVALVQFDTVWTSVQLLALMGFVQFLIGNVVSPRYMGKTLNLSPFVVIVALTFWGTIWGIEGAFLSVPITASLAIICQYVPGWRWIAILLSSDGRVANSTKSQEHTPPAG